MSERGEILLEIVWSMGITSLVISALVVLVTNVSHTVGRISRAHEGVLAATKVLAATSVALKVRERNRLPFASTITKPPLFASTSGTKHPLSNLDGPTAPRSASDILSVVDLAQRYRGDVKEPVMSGTTISAKVCGFARVPPSPDFKSFLLYSVETAYQVIGSLTPLSRSCAEIRGSLIQGLVTHETEFRSPPLVFIPVEREYSLFVDTTATFRIASHIGSRVIENQPIVTGIEHMTLRESRATDNITFFNLRVKPLFGREISALIVPGLSQRTLWGEVLP